jgi:hypothetical protein
VGYSRCSDEPRCSRPSPDPWVVPSSKLCANSSAAPCSGAGLCDSKAQAACAVGSVLAKLCAPAGTARPEGAQLETCAQRASSLRPDARHCPHAPCDGPPTAAAHVGLRHDPKQPEAPAPEREGCCGRVRAVPIELSTRPARGSRTRRALLSDVNPRD